MDVTVRINDLDAKSASTERIQSCFSDIKIWIKSKWRCAQNVTTVDDSHALVLSRYQDKAQSRLSMLLHQHA
jgi:hypothetical protein